MYMHKTINAYIAAAAKTSDAINIKDFEHIAIELPLITSGCVTTTCNVYCQVADTATGTFRRVSDIGVYSAASGIYNWEVPSTTGNCTVLCRPAGFFNYMKVEISNSATAGGGNGLEAKVHVMK